MRAWTPRSRLAATASLLLASAGAALAPSFTGPPTVAARGVVSSASCELAPETATLRVAATGSIATITRSDQAIVFRNGDGPVPCTGGDASVSTVDTIAISAETEVRIDLRNGPFAPGLTPEDDGSPEIEFDAGFRRKGGLRIRGSAGGDAISLGRLDGDRAANLDARERTPDADVVVRGGLPVISVLGRGGNDRVSARGGPVFDGPLQTGVSVSAGIGNDRVIGSDSRDLIGGGTGRDLVAPRAGRDRVRTAGGSDTLRLRDGERDLASCGGAHDQAAADGIDRLAGCE